VCACVFYAYSSHAVTVLMCVCRMSCIELTRVCVCVCTLYTHLSVYIRVCIYYGHFRACIYYPQFTHTCVCVYVLYTHHGLWVYSCVEIAYQALHVRVCECVYYTYTPLAVAILVNILLTTYICVCAYVCIYNL